MRELSLIVTESFSGITSTVVVVEGIVVVVLVVLVVVVLVVVVLVVVVLVVVVLVVVVLVVVVSTEAEILTSVELLTIYTYDVPRNKTIKNIMNEIIFDLLFI